MDAQELRRLLELAAKAIGLEGLSYCNAWRCMAKYHKGGGYFDKKGAWSPYFNDGDAMRLAVKLHLHIIHNDPGEPVLWVSAVLNKTFIHAAEEFTDEGEREYATRLAVLRAAAAIGESMQKGDE